MKSIPTRAEGAGFANKECVGTDDELHLVFVTRAAVRADDGAAAGGEGCEVLPVPDGEQPVVRLPASSRKRSVNFQFTDAQEAESRTTRRRGLHRVAQISNL